MRPRLGYVGAGDFLWTAKNNKKPSEIIAEEVQQMASFTLK